MKNVQSNDGRSNIYISRTVGVNIYEIKDLRKKAKLQ
jgi:hypothetical protein